MPSLAIIGGTGLDQLDGLEIVDRHCVQTPYGDPSRAVEEGRMAGQQVFFLQRHGSPRAIPPHLINYRANLWALRSLGASQVIGINAVGGITPAMLTGTLVIPDQVIDYTWGREHTVDVGEGGSLQHIDFTEPYSLALRAALLRAARDAGLEHEAGGVHGVMQGPRLESAAEVRRLARDGCDLVGMTGMPEASLARELGLDYASVCMVVNPAAGLSDAPITLDSMRDALARGAGAVRALLQAYIAAESPSAG
ncbi:S-methyl-5'-thioinosine phosphorylase [Mangrovimicrobium sediminis]|uniref:Probable 6-oxopurine nucleoside phosphorylase n=1 Tax=Mangrovimicrobium sediminis TaxID=2562682 RepID=A0A4Z0M2A4_9GAMM|nr:S-methyl-5'-thioinosine phosphorylase [Haliea sp. SAOS-164]TGD73586.1 S-methyl-5'-thioinosine phosphorylase [Haliea sp. SAOS-164]